MTRRIGIFGSTGSIGTQTLEVLESFPNEFDVVTLTARSSEQRLRKQAHQWDPEGVVLTEPAGDFDPETYPCPVLHGDEGLVEAVNKDLDLIVMALVGAKGLESSIEAIDLGIDLALATKEVLVMAGEPVNQKLRSSTSRLYPVDSEHNGIDQLIRGEELESIRKIYLTASGGPFRGRDRETLGQVSPEDAVDHPNWNMGKKISTDSATMMNKGLELIEARYLFDLEPEQLDAVIHPQSMVHAMVEFQDHSVVAQCGPHDMKLPIQNALFSPERREPVVEPLDFKSGLEWDFEPIDRGRYPAFRLAEQAMARGGTAPAVLNAANEVAVEQFLNERVSFLEIPEYVEAALESVELEKQPTLDEILHADREARNFVRRSVTGTTEEAHPSKAHS